MLELDDLEDPLNPKQLDQSEFRIQVAIIKHIREKRAFTAFIFAIFQGRDAKQGFFLKMMGVIAGVADLCVLWRSKCECGVSKACIGFLEIKRQGGVQSTPQRKFAGICHWLGIPYAIVRSVTEAHDTLKEWGCPENHRAIEEPDLRTTEQKLKSAADMLWSR